MAKDFKFPDIGEGITEGEVVRWLVKEGDAVKTDQALAEVETDKAVVEMPSPYAGTVLKLHVREKEMVKVGQVLVTIGTPGEAVAAAPAGPVSSAAAEGGASAPGVVGRIFESREEIRDILATPRVRRMAKDLGVDLKTVRGTGPEGRVTEEDVKKASSAAPAAAPPRAPKLKPKFDFYGSLERIPLRGVRRATAKHMAEAVSRAAHVTHFDQADLTELAALREKLKADPAFREVKLTYLPFIVKAVVEALKLHPLLNASLDDEDEEIIVKKYYNIGIAVDVPDGLIVPVVKAADEKGIADLAAEIQRLAEAARKRTLDLADLKGGTFSITNAGAIGGEYATPIINYPETAILATLRIAERPRVVGGRLEVRKTLPLCLSFDHRVVDGAEAARFTNDIIKRLESPAV